MIEMPNAPWACAMEAMLLLKDNSRTNVGGQARNMMPPPHSGTYHRCCGRILYDRLVSSSYLYLTNLKPANIRTGMNEI